MPVLTAGSAAQVWLANLNANNETIVNGSIIKDKVALSDGAKIAIHGRAFMYEAGESAFRSLSWLLPARRADPHAAAAVSGGAEDDDEDMTVCVKKPVRRSHPPARVPFRPLTVEVGWDRCR